MNENQFWTLVEAAREAAGPEYEMRVDTLKAELEKLPLEEIQAFQMIYEELLGRANQWRLWGAAYLMNGGCSDDGFRYFCDWLISEGRATYDAALRDPDTLAKVDRQEYFELELYEYVAHEVYQEKGGGEIRRSFSFDLSMPEGEEWEEDALPSMFPKLAAIYCE